MEQDLEIRSTRWHQEFQKLIERSCLLELMPPVFLWLAPLKDRVHGLQENGLSMRSGYLEMEEESGHGSQGLWFRASDKE